ncbi:MAG: hypothetical protein RIE58_07810 [Vicingaceae bacterium]
MVLLTYTCVSCVLLLMAYEDLRYRSVHKLLFALSALCLSALALMSNLGALVLLKYFVINCLICLALFAVLKLHFSIKEGKRSKVIDRLLGLGDVLMILTFGLVFHPVNFIYFLFGSFLLTLVVHSLYVLFKSNSSRFIPLIFYMNLAFVSLLIYDSTGEGFSMFKLNGLTFFVQ